MKVIVDLCLVPIGVGTSLSKYIVACEQVLTDAELETSLHAYGTNIEGDWDAVFAAIKRCHEVIHEMGAPRITTTIKLGTRTDREQAMEDKVESVKSKLQPDSPEPKSDDTLTSRVKLDRIIEEMSLQSNEVAAYLNRKTGKIEVISKEYISIAERGTSLDGHPDWQQEILKICQDILYGNDYISLPSSFEIHEYNIMEKFSLSIENEKISDALYYAIKGKGAFRRFKETIHRFGIVDEWYSYRSEVLKGIAINWCGQNGIEYDE